MHQLAQIMIAVSAQGSNNACTSPPLMMAASAHKIVTANLLQVLQVANWVSASHNYKSLIKQAPLRTVAYLAVLAILIVTVYGINAAVLAHLNAQLI